MADDVQVRDNPDLSRYEIYVDGALAGYTAYGLHGEDADFLHTQIDDAYEGHGLGSKLIGAALDDARSRGLRVLPYCPFVRSFLEKHSEYADLVPPSKRSQFGLPE
ncbi:MAG TPA: GNAT family N-acetyltransferase [Jatrophihabitans sp.]|nr:GNAT family N-acetyltransferase [Jatrophihabitans sp.]